jgi:hypothetical protein
MSGSSSAGFPNIINNGTIESTSTQSTQIVSIVSNYGLFTVKGGKCIVSTFSQYPTGNLTLANGATFKHLNDSTGLILKGILNGNGIIDSIFTQPSYLTPGFGFLDVGKIQFIGDLKLDENSFYNVEILGIEKLDFITVTGKTTITGVMTVNFTIKYRLL